MTQTWRVRLRGVSKSFGAVRAVDSLDLDIEPGEAVALLGPNGAGKSTTISMMLGLSRPDTGTVSVFGVAPVRAVQAGHVGAMLQDAGFVPNATVRDLVELARALYPKPLPTKEILATAGLTEVAGVRLHTLSSGDAQRARCALVRAGQPTLSVRDAPTAGRDGRPRQALWAATRRYAAAGRTVLFATHYLEQADD